MRDAFERAYKDAQWHNGSGSGSSPDNTVQYRTFLATYMRQHDVTSVLDVGCGDWQFSRLIEWPGPYLGIDLVPELIGYNHVAYGGPLRRFECADVFDLPPGGIADLILVKDLLQHWPDADIARLRGRLDGYRALITYDLGSGDDIAPGGYRPLDLTADRYGWPVTEVLRYDSVSHEGTVTRTKVVMELAP